MYAVINPRRACAARVTVVVLSVCLSVHRYLTSRNGIGNGSRFYVHACTSGRVLSLLRGISHVPLSASRRVTGRHFSKRVRETNDKLFLWHLRSSFMQVSK